MRDFFWFFEKPDYREDQSPVHHFFKIFQLFSFEIEKRKNTVLFKNNKKE
jgi:hypothetical protein